MLENLSTTNSKNNWYDIILDAVVFHVFSNEDRQGYIITVEYLIKVGDLYIELCFSEKETCEGRPHRIKNSLLNKFFSSIKWLEN